MNAFEKKMIIMFKFGLKKRISLYERLCAFLESGIPAYDAVTTIRDRYKKRNDSIWKMFDQWANDIKRGTNLSDAMKPWVPIEEYMLIAAGEMGAGIEIGLKESTKMSEASARMKSAIKTGLAMPVVLLLMLYFMMHMFQSKMAPTFKSLLPVARWPESAKTLYDISDFIVTYDIYIGGTLAVLGFIIMKTLGSWTGGIRNKLDKIPPWSVYKNFQASSFLIGLASMLQSGIALNESLLRMKSNSSAWTAAHISIMVANLKRVGDRYGEALNTGLFEEEISGDIEDYSRLSSFETAIYKIGAKMVVVGVEKTEQNMALVRNLMLVLVAGCVFWIYGTSYGLQTTIAESMQNSR